MERLQPASLGVQPFTGGPLTLTDNLRLFLLVKWSSSLNDVLRETLSIV